MPTLLQTPEVFLRSYDPVKAEKASNKAAAIMRSTGRDPNRPPGVGDCFEQIAESIGLRGIDMGCGTGCGLVKARMNALGPDGCRREYESLVDSLRRNKKKIGLKKQLAAIALSVWTGLAFRVDPLDPLPGMLTEAIRMAEEASRK
jgi:hypothetical protein